MKSAAFAGLFAKTKEFSLKNKGTVLMPTFLNSKSVHLQF